MAEIGAPGDGESWLRPSAPAPRGVVLLTHGLNSSPAAFAPLARRLQHAGFEVLLAAFTGHRGVNADFLAVRAEEWERDARRFHASASARARELGVPVHHVAYSMSGLILQALREDLCFDRRVYFAPALALKPWYPLAMLVAHALPWVRFRSRIPAGYFANATSGFRGAIAMHSFWKRWARSPDSVPTLIWANRGDELVSARGLRCLARAPWEYREASTSGCTLPVRYHHLIIDEPCLGAAEWERVGRETVEFLGR